MTESVVSDCYCRKIPMKTLTNDKDIISKIEELVLSANHTVRETYQFIRLYFLYLLENGQELPEIDRSLCKMVFSIVSNGQNRKGTTQSLQDLKSRMVRFYTEEYLPLQTFKVKVVGKDILDHEITSIVTSVENHIKNSFFDYVKRLSYGIWDGNDKNQRTKIYKDLFDGTLKSNERFHEDITFFSSDIRLGKQGLYKTPQKCLPLLFSISQFLEEKGKKLLAFLPLRRSFIPAYITLSAIIVKETFKDIMKVKQLDIWKNISDVVYDKLGRKERFSFTSIKTNGVSCSLIFSLPKKEMTHYIVKQKREKAFDRYIEDLKTYEDLEGKKLVFVDPNKGNLMYCRDEEGKTLRYTQNERRKVTKKNKYKKILKDKEDNVFVRLSSDDEFHCIQDDLDDISSTNSRTVSFEGFKEYIEKKNKMALRYKDIYAEFIFRKLKWNTKINLQRSEDTFINRFRETYGKKNVVIIFGDWEERPAFSRGKEPTKGKSLRKMMARAGYPVYLIDECRTSKLCCECHSENENNFVQRNDKRPWKKGQTQDVWGLLRCTNGNCRRIHNRDWNSVSNMVFIVNSIIDTGSRPLVFTRSERPDHACAESI